MSDSSVFIGNKPVMNRAAGVVIQFTVKNLDDAIIKASGKFI